MTTLSPEQAGESPSPGSDAAIKGRGRVSIDWRLGLWERARVVLALVIGRRLRVECADTPFELRVKDPKAATRQED